MGLVEQYFEANNLYINPNKTHYTPFQMKQCRQESELKLLIKNRQIVNVKSIHFFWVIADSNLS
jgi:hypothetical protein